jgi:mannose-6-phosphate isomerase-like protein (cupin superfamily)
VTYPPSRYHDRTGQVSGTFRPADAPPELASARGAVHYLATAASTSGEYGLFRWDMTSEPSGPDPHFHRSMSESFFVLTGTIQLFDGERRVDATPGDFLYVPPGGIHAFRNESGAPASMLILFAPGAHRERYFEELAEIATSGRTLSDEEWTELFARHDQFMV